MLRGTQYASQLYEDDPATKTAAWGQSEATDGDIESEIQKEIEGIRKPSVEPLFKNVRLSGNCCELHRHSQTE